MRVIEAEIRNYHQTVQTLRELEESIALPGQGEFSDGTRSTEPGDPTPSRAIRDDDIGPTPGDQTQSRGH